MSDNAGNLGKKITGFDYSPEFDGFSKIIINVGENEDGTTLSYEAGNESGRTLEFTNPFGTQAMANNLLNSFSGFQYQPYEAEGAILNPAAELGDAITISGIYSGIYKNSTDFGRTMASNISAPQDEALDYEVPHLSLTNRELTRMAANTRSEFSIFANQIAAKVSKTGGTISSFEWVLNDDSWTLKSNGNEVFKATSAGIEVTGVIKATSGYIGNSSSGFEITASSIRNGVQSMSDTSHYGVYVGTDGICLGKGSFKVDSYGNMTASNATINGAVNCTSLNVANDTGCVIGGTSFSGSQFASALGGGFGFAGMQNGSTADWGRFRYCTAGQIETNSLYVDVGEYRYNASWKSKTVITGVWAATTVSWLQSGTWLSAVGSIGAATTTLYYLGRD